MLPLSLDIPHLCYTISIEKDVYIRVLLLRYDIPSLELYELLG